MGRSMRIWEYKDVKIEQDGGFVKLTAPCGAFRRVRPEAARKMGMDLLTVATQAATEEAAKMTPSQPPSELPLETLKVIAEDPDLEDQYSG